MDPMYWQLLLITIIPVVVTVGLYFIKEKTKFYDLPYWPRQIIIGVIFGGLAVVFISKNNMSSNNRGVGEEEERKEEGM